MKKTLLVCLLALAMVLLLAGCGCSHEWYVATCTAPKTCHLCGETEGAALGHTWQDADCLTPKTCTVCKDTEGDPLGHSWQDADCLTPKTCSLCHVTEGEALGHDWQEATTEDPETCSLCNLTQGERLITDFRFTTASTKELHGTWVSEVHMTKEMLGLEAGFENGLACRLIMEFTKTGELFVRIELADEEAFIAELKATTIQILYDSLAAQGLNKAQADKWFQDNYKMTVEAYVDQQLKGYNIAAIFDVFKLEGCYYVEYGYLFVADSWDSQFDSTDFTLENGVLTIEELFLPTDGAPLVFTRAE